MFVQLLFEILNIFMILRKWLIYSWEPLMREVLQLMFETVKRFQDASEMIDLQLKAHT